VNHLASTAYSQHETSSTEIHHVAQIHGNILRSLNYQQPTRTITAADGSIERQSGYFSPG
jgi:copper oxidase (laccase) domain-containing protein